MFVSPSNSLWLFVDTLCSKSWSWQTVINYVQYQYPSNIEWWPCSCLVMWYCIHAYVCILICIWSIYIYTHEQHAQISQHLLIYVTCIWICVHIDTHMRCWHTCPYVQIILMIYIYIHSILSYDPYLLILSDIPIPINKFYISDIPNWGDIYIYNILSDIPYPPQFQCRCGKVIHVSQLFSRGSALRQRAALFVLHCCVEGKAGFLWRSFPLVPSGDD